MRKLKLNRDNIGGEAERETERERERERGKREREKERERREDVPICLSTKIFPKTNSFISETQGCKPTSGV